MASAYEDLAVYLFERKFEHWLTIHRSNMKKAMLAALKGGPEPPPDEHYEAISEMYRTPDAMAWVPARFAPKLGFSEIDVILAIEAEHTSPIPWDGLCEYADIWATFDSVSDHWTFGVVVIDHYGRWIVVDLEGIWCWSCSPRAKKFHQS